MILISTFLFAEDAVKKTAEEMYKTALLAFKDGNFENAALNFENAVNFDHEYFFLMTGNKIFERLLESKLQPVAKDVEKICIQILKISESNYFALYYLGWAEIILEKNKNAEKHLKNAKDLMKKEEVNFGMVEQLIALITT